jgi:hypothetical protein
MRSVIKKEDFLWNMAISETFTYCTNRMWVNNNNNNEDHGISLLKLFF